MSTRDYFGMAFAGAVMGAAAVLPYFTESRNLEAARTMSFCVLALAPLIHAFSCRSPLRSAVAERWSGPLMAAVVLSTAVHLLAVLPTGLRPVFHTVALSGAQWQAVALLSLAVWPAVEAAKAAARGRTSGGHPMGLRPSHRYAS